MTWYIDVPARNVLRTFGLVFSVAVLFMIAYAAREAIAVLASAGFLAIATHRPVTYLAAHTPHIGRKIAATAVFLCIGVVVVFIIYLVMPLLTTQGQQLLSQLPGYIDSLRSGDTLLSQWLLQLDAFSHAEALLTSVFQSIVDSAEVTVSVAGAIIRNMFGIFFTVLIGFALVVEGPQKITAAELLLSPEARRHSRALRDRVLHAVTGFVNGRLIITTIAASLSFVLLSIFNVPAPLSLAAVIWFTGLIPLVGNTLGAVIVILVALSQSLFIALFLLGYYVVYQQIENSVFDPIVQSRTVHLTPLTVLISGIIGVMISGFLGALLAIPIGASMWAMAEYYLSQRRAEPEADKKA